MTPEFECICCRPHRVRGARRFQMCGYENAGVVKLVDTPDLGSGGESRGGSSPSTRTIASMEKAATPNI